MTTTTNAERLALAARKAGEFYGLANGIERSLATYGSVTLSGDDWKDVCEALRSAAALRAQPADAGVRSAYGDYTPITVRSSTDRPPRPALNDPVVDPRNSEEGDERSAPLVDLVSRFSGALLAKLKAAEAKYGYNNAWMRDGWDATCQEHLIEHLAKGDPLDVAAYCAFMWHHGWATAPATPPQPAVSGEVREAIALEIWHRFAPTNHIEWADETHKAEYLFCADAILALPLIADQSAALAEARETLLHAANHLSGLEYQWTGDREAIWKPIRAAIDRIDGVGK